MQIEAESFAGSWIDIDEFTEVSLWGVGATITRDGAAPTKRHRAPDIQLSVVRCCVVACALLSVPLVAGQGTPRVVVHPLTPLVHPQHHHHKLTPSMATSTNVNNAYAFT